LIQYEKTVFLMHGHLDLKKSHFDPRNRVPDEEDASRLLLLLLPLLCL
jgi:hypothetical protein